MNKRFLLVDKINNIQKEATCILLFQNNNDNYLIYYLNENNGNKQIFVSKVIRNTEGKYFISDINNNDKNRINSIVYNIVIVLPAANDNNVIEDFENKNNIKISLDPLNFESQNYLHNSRVAITSEILVNNCINFYNKHLNSGQKNDIQNNDSMQVHMINNIDVPTIPIEANNNLDNSNTVQANNVIPQVNNSTVVSELPNVNPQMQIIGKIESNAPVQIASNNDENLIKNNNDNNDNNEGFVINTAIVVGTIALLLAVTIVTFTFITIKKMII